MNPPENATKTPEKCMNEAVIVLNWKYSKSNIKIRLMGITSASLLVALSWCS